MEVLQHSQKCRVGTRMLYPYPGYCCIVARAFRTYRSFWYGYEYCTELKEVPGTGMDIVHNLQKNRYGKYPGKCPGYGSVHTLQNTSLFHVAVHTVMLIAVSHTICVSEISLHWL